MTAGQPAESRRPQRGGLDDGRFGHIALVLLIVLAVIATIITIVTNSQTWTRIGTLAALWAAFIGYLAVVKSRRVAASAESRVRDLHTVYELQLEREISARREHELVLEKQLRQRVAEERSQQLDSLRTEIVALREQLSQLSGGPIFDEPQALCQQHRREINEGSAPSAVSSERVERRSAGGLRRGSTPSTHETTAMTPVGGNASLRPAETGYTSNDGETGESAESRQMDSGESRDQGARMFATRAENNDRAPLSAPEAAASEPARQTPVPGANFTADDYEWDLPALADSGEGHTSMPWAAETDYAPQFTERDENQIERSIASMSEFNDHKDDSSSQRHVQGQSVAELMAKLNGEGLGGGSGSHRRRRAN